MKIFYQCPLFMYASIQFFAIKWNKEGTTMIYKLCVMAGVGSVFLLSAMNCQSQTIVADKVYFGGDIITMEGESPNYAEAVATLGEKIIFSGSKEQALEYAIDKTKLINLEGKTLLPGFVDPHSHVFGVGQASVVSNLLPAPDGTADTVEKIINLLKGAQNDEYLNALIKKSGWIVGTGYDDALLDYYPTKNDLDKVSTELPVLIIHASGHLGVANSKALELAGITAESKDPQGGVIRRIEGSQEPNGILEENAFLAVLVNHVYSKIDVELQDMMLAKGQEIYAQYGYTTAQEGRAMKAGLSAIERAAGKNQLIMDIVAYPDMVMASDAMDSKYNSLNYANHFRIGGVKLSLDGSPQGKTAWLSEPYFHPPHGKDADYKGYPIFKDEQTNQYVETAFKNNWQVLAHANGDAAIDQFIGAVSAANSKLGKQDRRAVLIHGQALRSDQIGQLVKEDMFPSLFPLHTFYWGDWHAESVFGQPRADFLSPTKAVRDAGLMFTTHHDAPVVPPNALRVLDATVNRTTRSGKVLGPEQRVDVYTALKAMTIWAAYQHFEESTKGSISVGKNADFVILDKNPLKIEPRQLNNLKVEETISRGKTIYSR